MAFVFYPFNSAMLKIKTHRKGEKRMNSNAVRAPFRGKRRWMNKIAQMPNCLIVKHNFKFRILSQLKSIFYFIIQFCKGTISYYIIVSLNILINTNRKKYCIVGGIGTST